MGYITAPTDDPEATSPNAAARRRLNQVDVHATPGMNRLGLVTYEIGGYIPTATPVPIP